MPHRDATLADALAEFLEFSSFVPDEYAAYRPVIATALAYFLDHLAPHRRAAILAEQAALPVDTPPAKRLVDLLHHCPTLHKLGQVLARDRRLEPALRAQLQRLESIIPRTPLASALTILRHDLGDLHDSGVTLGDELLAEASVAVVVPFTWSKGGSDHPFRGVFKVLKPGVTERLHEELAIWMELGAILDDESARRGLPALHYRDTLESVRDLLASEINLSGEQMHLRSAARAYFDLPDVIIPHLLADLCSARVTAMERVDGVKVTEWTDASHAQRSGLARTIIRALLAHVFWNPADQALFHADPHAGNLCVTPDGKLGIYDWSLTSTLSKPARIALTQAALHAFTRGAAGVESAILQLAQGPVDRQALASVVQSAIDALGPRLPGLEWLTSLLDAAAWQASVRFQPSMLLFRKALHSIRGVLVDLEPAADVDAALWQEGVRRFLGEWPARLLAPPWDRSFPTHLSNADLAWTTWSLQSAVMPSLRGRCQGGS